MIEINELNYFLKNAKKNTYANETVKKTNSSRLNSKDYEFTDIINNKKLLYHDTYFGGTRFIGEEVVYDEFNKPIWAMNYYGKTLNNDLQESEIDKILRKALMNVGIDKSIIPVRGPREYIHNEYKYELKVKGKLDNFTGIEKITKNELCIYELELHGGFIDSNLP